MGGVAVAKAVHGEPAMQGALGEGSLQGALHAAAVHGCAGHGVVTGVAGEEKPRVAMQAPELAQVVQRQLGQGYEAVLSALGIAHVYACGARVDPRCQRTALGAATPEWRVNPD